MTDSSTSDDGHMLSPAHLIEGGVELADDVAILQPPAAGLELFDIFQLSRRLEFDGDGAPSAGSDEDFAQSRQRALWRRLYNDPRGAWRSLVIPDAEMIARIDALDLICPHCCDVTGWVSRAARLAMETERPLRLDPCVLLGEPGVGKTYYARQLAAAIGVPTLTIAMNLITDRGSAFTGLTPVWRASAPGKVAQLLIDSYCASPVIVIDEVEKANPINPSERPENVLHTFFESENAARFTDEFVDLPLRADHVIWITTANSLAPLPAAIVDRLIAFEIKLAPEQMLAIQRSLFNEANRATGDAFALPDATLLARLATQTPRALSRLWPIAMAFAVAGGRRIIATDDVTAAEAILGSGKDKVARIGFLAGVPVTKSADRSRGGHGREAR